MSADDTTIRELYDSGKGMPAVADALGISQYFVRKALVRTGGTRPRRYSHARSDIAHAEGRTCRRCGEWKPASAFPTYLDARLASKCHRCKRAVEIKRSYGLEIEEYEALVEKQSGSCAICGEQSHVKSNGRTSLSVDHCHVTSAIRGLLCHRCNLYVGYYEALSKFGTERITAYLGQESN